LHSINSGAASSGQTKDTQTPFRPSEMLGPDLCVWIVQPNHITGFWIDSGYSIVFEQIAAPTGQTQVAQSCTATQKFRNNVVNRKFGPG